MDSRGIEGLGAAAGRLGRTLVWGLVLLLASCGSRGGLALFFDIPDKPPREKPVAVPGEELGPAGTDPARTSLAEDPRTDSSVGTREKLPVEKTLVWKEAELLLPKDATGEVDWMEALRRGTIKPKSSVEGADEPFIFKFDFHFSETPGLLGAYFPHSAHTQWLRCESCHPALFPQPGTKLSMAKILNEEYCGKCHTTVAFPVAKGCRRCHAPGS